MAAIEPFMKAEKPDQAQMDDGKKKLTALLEGDDSLQRESAKIMIPIITDVGMNLLDTEDKIAEVKKKLVGFLGHERDDGSRKRTVGGHRRSDRTAQGRSGHHRDSCRASMRRSTQPPRNSCGPILNRRSPSLPPICRRKSAGVEGFGPVVAAREKLATLKPIRDPGEKRRAIAHLLYHFDAFAGTPTVGRAIWYNFFIAADPKASTTPEGFRFQTADEDHTRPRRAAWHQRVAAVVGLESYVGAAEAQAAEYAKMVQRIRTRIVQEQRNLRVRISRHQ